MEQQVTQYTTKYGLPYVLTCYLLLLKTPQDKRKYLHLFSDNKLNPILRENSFVIYSTIILT